MRRIGVVLSVLLLAAVSLVAQQANEPISYLALYTVKPGQEATFVDLVKKYDKRLFDKLQAEGVVLAWGLDTRVIHREGGSTHMLWWVTRDFAGMDAVFAGLRQLNVPPADQEKFRAATDPSRHHDYMNRTILENVREEEPSAPLYTSWSFVKVDTGKSSEWRKLFDKYNKPVLDKLVADGTIYGYGIDVEFYHTEDPGWHANWLFATSLGAMDKVIAAFAADRQARSEEERESIGRQFRSITSPADHRDSLWRAVPMKEGSM